MAEIVRRDSPSAGLPGHHPGAVVGGVERPHGGSVLAALARGRGVLDRHFYPAAQTDVGLRPGP